MGGKEATIETISSRMRPEQSHSGFAAARAFFFCWVAVLSTCKVAAQEASVEKLHVRGNVVSRWQIEDAEASLLQGDCELAHADRVLHADAILLLVDGPAGRVRTRIVIAGKTAHDKKNIPRAFTLLTRDDPQIVAPRVLKKPAVEPELLRYLPADDPLFGNEWLSSIPSERRRLQQVQFEESVVAPGPENVLPAPGKETGDSSSVRFLTGGGTKSIEIGARDGSTQLQIEMKPRPELGDTVVLARGGVTVLIRDVTVDLPGGMMDLGTISLSADRVVGWLPEVGSLFNRSDAVSPSNGEIYLEGDIVFRQGERIIYANSMYYNIATQQGMVLDSEVITTIPNYQGVVRLKADVLQQVAKGNFIAFDAAVTSSRMGVPQYWLQSERLQLTDRERIMPDPVTGLPASRSEAFVNSRDNFVYFGGVPILYWPTFSTSLERPGYYVSGVKLRNDQIFGTQLLLDFDLFQLLGIENAPPGADWEMSLDYLSERGPAIGTMLEYSLPSIFGFNGPVDGYFDTWVIHDDGNDDLGAGRRNLPPSTRFRGRSLLHHRHYLNPNLELIGEFGWISDRNFLDQYFEAEWDRDINESTALRVRKYRNNHLFDLTGQVRINDFFTTTEDLPMLDHYMIGSSIFGDRFTWSAHNKIGYSRLQVGDLPESEPERSTYSPIAPAPGIVGLETVGLENASGVVAGTRQKLALPVQVGPVRVVPSVSGEASYYGEAADGEPLTRLFGQGGVMATLPASRVDPTIQSSLLNVRGLAHKIEWQAEYFYADSNSSLDALPLYNPLDDHAQQQYRSRFLRSNPATLGQVRYQSRDYAFRQGIQRLVASPSDVIAGDLQQVRIGLHQRLQTKRGLPGLERIVDLFHLDLDLLVFPDSDRDNFGESFGPATYDMRYQVGDRVSLLSDGYFDFFDGGLRSISAGVRSTRPGLGDVYFGLLSLEGPISSTVFRSSLDYRLNEKWIISNAMSYDFSSTGNVSQSAGLTRIGESLLFRLGITYDKGRDNVGVGFTIEPRFWPRPKLGRVGGQLIPPPGVEGFE